MRIRRIMAFAAVVAAGISLTTVTTANADELTCSTPPLTSVPVTLADGDLWSYQYHVIWCVEDGRITDLAHRVARVVDGVTCDRSTNAEESETRVGDGSGAWNGFNMAEFSCKDRDGQEGSVNPWGIITVWPNGDSAVERKGIGDVIVRQVPAAPERRG